jgi:hypothetical protein
LTRQTRRAVRMAFYQSGDAKILVLRTSLHKTRWKKNSEHHVGMQGNDIAVATTTNPACRCPRCGINIVVFA